MGLLFRLLELLIVIVPVAGAIYAAFKAVSSARRQRDDAPRTDYEPDIDAGTTQPTTVNPAALWRTITRAIDEHSRTDSRWLDYELDPAKLLDFPLMTDLRDPLTERFHKAKIRATCCVRYEQRICWTIENLPAITWPPSSTTSPHSTLPRPKRFADVATISPNRHSSESCVLSGYCVWPRTTPRHQRNVNAHTIWLVRNSRV